MAYYVRNGLVFANSTTPISVASSSEPYSEIKDDKASPGFLPIEVVNSSTTPPPTCSPLAELIFPDGTRLNFYQPVELSFLRDLLN